MLANGTDNLIFIHIMENKSLVTVELMWVCEVKSFIAVLFLLFYVVYHIMSHV